MLDLRWVLDHLEEARTQLARRGAEATARLDRIAELGARRRSVLVELESLRARRNDVSAALANADKQSEAFAQARADMRRLGERIAELEAQARQVEADVEDELLRVPNLLDPSVPDGRDAQGNPVVRSWGERPAFGFAPRDHVELGTRLGILDFERAAKISGARFVVLRGAGARLERALIQFMLDLHADEHGYTEIWPPVLVRDEAMRGTGQLPKFAADAFRIAPFTQGEQTDERTLYLVPTAEVPVTNLHADEILDADRLPLAYVAYTPCFRSEAGAAGRDTRGMIRQHQFDKVELVRFCRPEDGPAELERLTGHAERVLQRLGLPYRVVLLCAGDTGFASRKTYDLEVWLPGQGEYREISSCSWFGDFQARRARIRFRRARGARPELAHTLNGSGLAVGRTLIAILENHQQSDGSVLVPEALRPYLGGMERLPVAS
ncbi:MAG: serine--tRNA ligase [Myxococcota bacterium]|nr:serine--tRNA ligase [Myxococcota bacterium]